MGGKKKNKGGMVQNNGVGTVLGTLLFAVLASLYCFRF